MEQMELRPEGLQAEEVVEVDPMEEQVVPVAQELQMMMQEVAVAAEIIFVEVQEQVV
jgi:hypothetical protein